jgi:hypothetical protein
LQTMSSISLQPLNPPALRRLANSFADLPAIVAPAASP